MKYVHLKSNFTSGELSPFMHGRTDVQKYENGARSIENYIVRPQGGLTRRPGTTYVKDAKDPSRKVRLHKFERSYQDSALLEFGHLYIRVHGATDIDLVSPYEDTQLKDLYFEQSGDVVFIFHPAHAPRKLSRLGGTSWSLSLYELEDGPYFSRSASQDKVQLRLSGKSDTLTLSASSGIFSSGDIGKYVEFVEDSRWRLAKIVAYISPTVVVGTYVSNVVEDLSFEAYLSDSGTIQKVVTLRVSTTTLTASASDYITRYDIGKFVRADSALVSATPDYKWYQIVNVSESSATSTVGAAITEVTYTYPTVVVSASNRKIEASLTASANLFSGLDVGRQIRLSFSGAVTWGFITSYTNPTTVGVELKETIPVDATDPTQLPNGGLTDDWKLGAFSDATGWPRCGVIHGQRMWVAGSNDQPFTLWGSQVDDFYSFATTELNSEVLDTNGLALTLASSDANAIYWLSSGPTLLIGTSGSEWQLRPSNAVNEAITPTNFSLTRQTEVGSSATSRPVRIGSSTLFYQTSGIRVWALAYDFNIDSYDATDLSILSDHILADRGGVVDTVFQKEPFGLLWLVLADGSLATLTFDKKQDVYAWSRHIISGTSAQVESIAVLSSSDVLGQRPYVAVSRLVNGIPTRTIERFGHIGSLTEPYVDSCEEFTPSGLEVSGASRLNGLVQWASDGRYGGALEVVDGSATLPNTYARICMGFPYGSWVTPLPLDIPTQEGSTVGSLRTPYTMIVRVFSTDSLAFKPAHDAERVVSVDPGQDFITFKPESSSDGLGSVKFGCNQAYHSTLLSCAMGVTVGQSL